MRVVVKHPERTEEDGTEVAESLSAYRVGRIEDHVDLLTGETTPMTKVAQILAEQAAKEFPGCEISIQHLHVAETDENGRETRHEWKDEPPETPAAPGETVDQTLEVSQAQEATS